MAQSQGLWGGGDTALSLLPVGYGTPSEQRIAPMVGWQVAMSQRGGEREVDGGAYGGCFFQRWQNGHREGLEHCFMRLMVLFSLSPSDDYQSRERKRD